MNDNLPRSPRFRQICLVTITLLMLSANQAAYGMGSASQKLQSVQSDVLTAEQQTSFSEKMVNAIWPTLDMIKALHPIAIAALLLLLVLGVCFLMTDNSELELYFKIEFSPPKTEILQ